MTSADQDDRTLPDTPATVARLVANHREFLGFLAARVGDRALAEDILQDAFVRGISRLEGLRDDESAIAWFYRILRNAVIDHHRRHEVKDRRLAALAAELDAAQPEHDVHGIVCQCVARLADNLKPEYAEALRRIEVDGVAVKDYADEAGITRNNAAVRVFRAREALKRQVVRSCGTCAEHGCLDCTCGAGHCGR
jgi:RNA polymerase sigma-70 factor (ECF subfamily)